MQYIRVDEDNLKALKRSVDNGDTDSQRDIINNMSTELFLGNLVSIKEYDPFVSSLSKKIIENNIPTEESKIKPIRRISKRKYGKQRISKPKKVIKQKQKTGIFYYRSKPKRFTMREVTFLKYNKNLSNKDLVVKYNKLFDNRTESSIISKKYRVK